MKHFSHDHRAGEGVVELCWYWLLCLIVALVFHRFSSATWFGKYPSAGATVILYLVSLPIAFSGATPAAKGIRFGVPTVLLYLFYSSAADGGGFVAELQGKLTLSHFILFFAVTALAIFFTAEKPAPEQVEQKFAVKKEKKSVDVNQTFGRIVGQEHVISPLREIANMVRSGIRVGKKNAPHAVLLFLGPTGVGKTEAANALAEAVYGSKDALIRFDMGQFTDAHQASRFYGPPPGYAGYEEGGQLTRAVLRKPRSVVLLDEVEKAHPQIWDAFLPVFDEGYIVDGSTNQRVDMTGTIIVLTSNLLAGQDGLSGLTPLEVKEAVQATGSFRPELLGRINEILVFKPLDADAVAEILKRRLDAALWNLAEQGISLTADEHDIAVLVDEVRAAKFGVRQIDDVVRTYLRRVIAEKTGGKGPAPD